MDGSVLGGCREAGGATSLFSVRGLGEDSLREGGGAESEDPVVLYRVLGLLACSACWDPSVVVCSEFNARVWLG